MSNNTIKACWFSHLVRHLARKRSGSILSTPEPARALEIARTHLQEPTQDHFSRFCCWLPSCWQMEVVLCKFLLPVNVHKSCDFVAKLQLFICTHLPVGGDTACSSAHW